MTSVLAMLYLVMFAALALGFYAQTNLGAQVAGNEERVLEAQVAAESGLQFLRYELSRVKVAPTVPRAQVFEEIYNQLSAHLDGTLNLGPHNVGFTAGASPVIDVPTGANEFISLKAGGARFRATITPLVDGRVRIKAVGKSPGGAIVRAIAMDFVESPYRSPILDYGVATRGPATFTKGYLYGSPDQAWGTLLSTYAGSPTPVTLANAAVIGGDVYLSRPDGSVSGDGSVGGTSDPALRATHVHPNTPAPEFPTADPSWFVSYMVGKETPVTTSTLPSYLANFRIKAGVNPNFANGTYEGVILVEAPNVITFTGGSTIRGVIVVVNPDEASTGNRIAFTGGTDYFGPETLPASFGALRDKIGSGIIAPNFHLDMSGGASSFNGGILAKSMNISGGAGGSIKGNVFLTGTAGLSVSGSGAITITQGPGTPTLPAGMRFSHTYAPYPATYLEVAP